MDFLKNQLKRKVNIGARIYAGLLVLSNGMAAVSYYNILRKPDLLRTVADDMSLPLSEEHIQMILAEIPLQLVLIGIMIFGLFMLILNQRWGFIPYATIQTGNALMAAYETDWKAGLSALIPVLLMAGILWAGSNRAKRQAVETGADVQIHL